MLSICCFSLFLIAALTVQARDTDVLCRDEDGNAVDWYYMYKLPREYSPKRSDQFAETDGLRYLYITSETIGQGWKLSNSTVNETSSLPGQTIATLLDSTGTVLIAYNDESPDGQVNFDDGHTKGVIGADRTTGFWLIHSVPKFPDSSSYYYPTSGHTYGQSFLCLSLDSDQIDRVGKQQLYNEPNIYYARIPNEFREIYPNLVEATQKKWQQDAPFWNNEDLKTLNGTKFVSFAKGRQFGKELYEDWVAPLLDVSLLVETWRHGPGILPTNCTRRHHVLNIASVTEPDLDVSFQSTKDHSKWCVADATSDDWICVGDINRAEHQLSRGGGTVCQLNKDIATAYRTLVASVEPCPAEEIK